MSDKKEEPIAPALAILDKVVERLGNIKDQLIEVEEEINKIRKQRQVWRDQRADGQER